MIQKPNLLPPAYQPVPPVNWLRVGIIAAVLTIVFVFGSIGIKLYMDTRSLEAQISDLQHIIDHSSVLEETARINALQSEIRSLEGLMTEKDKRTVPLSVVFADVSRVMPAGLAFTRLDCSGNTLIIEGWTDVRRSVADYVIELRKFSWADKAEIIGIYEGETDSGRRGYVFEIITQLKEATAEGGQADVPGDAGSESIT